MSGRFMLPSGRWGRREKTPDSGRICPYMHQQLFRQIQCGIFFYYFRAELMWEDLLE